MTFQVAPGEDYVTFLRRHFFDPVGMSRTGTYPLTKQFSADEIAVGFGLVPIPPVNSPVNWGRASWLVIGSGGMVSTPMDVFRWNQALLGG